MAVDPVPVIQATLAPIFLVSGAAIFLNFTQARLFRVVDRLRSVAKDLKEAEDGDRADMLYHRGVNLRRAIILRNAILFGVLVIAFTVVTTLLILVGWAWGRDTGVWPIVAFSLGLLSFMVALMLVSTDAFLSVSMARHGHEFERGLRPGER